MGGPLLLNRYFAVAQLALPDAGDPWAKSGRRPIGITTMMAFFEKNYGKKYAPNTRETVRRHTIHQFVDAGMVVVNPDDPDRQTNGEKTVYRIDESVLGLVRSFGTARWDANLAAYREARQSLQQRHSRQRESKRIILEHPSGDAVSLSPGGRNVLIKRIHYEFLPRFMPVGRPAADGRHREKIRILPTGPA